MTPNSSSQSDKRSSSFGVKRKADILMSKLKLPRNSKVLIIGKFTRKQTLANLHRAILKSGSVLVDKFVPSLTLLCSGSSLIDGRPVNLDPNYVKASNAGIQIIHEEELLLMLNHHVGDHSCLTPQIMRQVKGHKDNSNAISRGKEPGAAITVTRKKCEREELPGHTCEHCSNFYDAIDTSYFRYVINVFVPF
mmetsp:Transcript_3163/g.4249  ORF Transcript_3163/g.4249 Transcript_3163/m.4249 type:complete len:193 (+) Transcript_3163:2-580(+)